MEQFEQEQSANTVEVAEPQQESLESTQVQSENISELAEPKTVQDAETNAQFAENRRKQELNEYRTKASNYESQLEKVARLAGHGNVNDFLVALEEAEKRHQIQQESTKLGIDEEAYIQHYQPINEKLSTLEQQLSTYQEREQQQAVENELSQLRSKYDDFSNYEDKVFDLAIEKGYNLEDAYKLATYEERINNVARQKEQEVIQKLQSNASSTPGSLGAGAEHKVGYSNMSSADKKALRERVKRGETIQL